MTKTFFEYLMESDQEYKYRIKTVEKLDDDQLDRLERLVQKYELRDITAPKKTIIQDHPLDFPDVNAAEVTIIDIVTGVPISAYVLQQEIRTNLKVAEKFIVVRSENDPLETETARIQAHNALDAEAEESDMEPDALLSTDSQYPEAEQSIPGDELYGDAHNKRFLDTLAQVSATRSPDYVENKGEGLFNWMNNEIEDAPEIMTDDSFNDHEDYEHAPKPVPWWKASSTDHRQHKDISQSDNGNFDDDSKIYTKKYKKADGEEVHLTTKTEGLRDD